MDLPSGDRRDEQLRPDTQRELAEVMAALKALKSPSGGSSPVGSDSFDDATKKLPGRGELIKAAPAVAMLCGTTIFLAIIAVFVMLTIAGKPTDELFRMMNLFLNATGAIGVLFTLAVAIRHANRTLENRRYAIASRNEAHNAAESADKAARSVNGDLDRRIARLVGLAVEQSVRSAVDEALRNQQPCSDPEDPPLGTAPKT